MSKIKLALDVVQDLRRLADSIEALCDGMEGINSAAMKQAREVQPGMEASQPSLIELRAFVADRSTPETRPLQASTVFSSGKMVNRSTVADAQRMSLV